MKNLVRRLKKLEENLPVAHCPNCPPHVLSVISEGENPGSPPQCTRCGNAVPWTVITEIVVPSRSSAA